MLKKLTILTLISLPQTLAAHTITVSVEDLDLNNAMNGEIIDQDLTITVTASASYSCTLADSVITFTNTVNPSDDFDLNVTLAEDCSKVNLYGTLSNGELGATYTGDLGLTATYD